MILSETLGEIKTIFLDTAPIIYSIGETIGETAGDLRGKYPYLKTVDAVQIAAALDAGAEAFLTNDKKVSKITEVKILVLKDYL